VPTAAPPAPPAPKIDQAAAARADAARPAAAKPLSLLDFPWALALLAYAAGATGLLCLVAAGSYRIGRWARRGRAVTDARVLGIFRAARQRLGLGRDVTVVESRRTLSPITVGTLHPVVLLPTGLADDSSDADLLAIALHELVHVRRYDSALLTLLSFVRAALFFHPLVWLACRQVSALAESACDDAVLEATGEPVSYAKMLARLAEQLPRHAVGTELAAGIVFSKGAFLRRVEAILSDRRDRIRRLSRMALAGTLAAAVVSVGVALALPLGEKESKNPATPPAPSAGSGPSTQPAGLPGSGIGNLRGHLRGGEIVAVMRAAEQPRPEALDGNARAVSAQVFEVVEFLGGNKLDRPVRVLYRYDARTERPIAKGRRVVWVLGHGVWHPDRSVQFGLKAFADTPANRRRLVEQVRAARKQPGKTLWRDDPLLLPGARVDLAGALKGEGRVIARCRALHQGAGMVTDAGVVHCWQRYAVLDVLSGQAEAKEVVISFTRFDLPYDRERRIAKGQTVIWIADPSPAGAPARRERPAKWRGVKALLDLPANRAALGLKAPASSPTNPFAALVRRSVEMIPQEQGIRGGGRPTGLDLRPMLAPTGQQKDLAAFPEDHRQWERATKSLADAGKAWALAALLDHENADVRILAARALGRLSNPRTTPVLLAAAKSNDYPVEGSESATIHYLYRCALKSALEKITGLKLTPKGLRITVYPKPREGRVVTSDEHPEQFREHVDFAKVESWLARRYPSPASGPSASSGRASPGPEGSTPGAIRLRSPAPSTPSAGSGQARWGPSTQPAGAGSKAVRPGRPRTGEGGG
jgi:beta-lactamase regulating signal transducer with metallopeptidase domain